MSRTWGRIHLGELLVSRKFYSYGFCSFVSCELLVDVRKAINCIFCSSFVYLSIYLCMYEGVNSVYICKLSRII